MKKYCLGEEYRKKGELDKARKELIGKIYRFDQAEDIFGGHFLMSLDEELLTIWYSAGATVYMFHFLTAQSGDAMLKCYDIMDISRVWTKDLML